MMNILHMFDSCFAPDEPNNTHRDPTSENRAGQVMDIGSLLFIYLVRSIILSERLKL